jgi:hypothetical protein
MKTKIASPLDLKQFDAKLRAWRKKYDMPVKIAALHRKAILKHVVDSMAFEVQPIGMARLGTLLKGMK